MGEHWGAVASTIRVMRQMRAGIPYLLIVIFIVFIVVIVVFVLLLLLLLFHNPHFKF